MSRPRRHFGRALGALGRRLARLAALGLALQLLAAVAGPLTAAITGSVLLIVSGVRWWAHLEARLFAPPQPPAQGVPARHREPAVDDDRHLAFAQALAVVAARYLAECEATALTRRQKDDRP
jgi:hypothetical protein